MDENLESLKRYNRRLRRWESKVEREQYREVPSPVPPRPVRRSRRKINGAGWVRMDLLPFLGKLLFAAVGLALCGLLVYSCSGGGYYDPYL